MYVHVFQCIVLYRTYIGITIYSQTSLVRTVISDCSKTSRYLSIQEIEGKILKE